MEDPESEWEIQEYSSSKAGDGSTSMMRWMLNKGLVIGKKLVITGIAISSAPLVVPPLLVFSAMGVAFSVPFGLVFASYACTNKLMSTLLPTPPPPPPLMLEYYYTSDGYEQEKDEGFELDDVGGSYDYRQTYLVDIEDDLDQEEKAFVTNVDEKVYYNYEEDNDNNLDENGFYINDDKAENVPINDDNKEDEDSKYTNENEIESYEKEDHVLQKENVIEEEEREKMEDLKQGGEMGLGSDEASDEIKPTEKASGTGFGVGVDDQGYEEDVGEYLEGDDESLEEPLMDLDKSTTQDVFEDDKEEIVKGSTGLLEKIRDEGRADSMVDERASNLDDDDDEVKDFKATEPVTVKEIGSQKLVKDGSNDEIVGEMRHVVILTGGNEDNNFNSRELEELDLVASEVKGDTNKEVRNTESDEKVMRESMGTQEKTSDHISNETSVGHISNDRSEDAVLRRKKEHPIDSNSYAKEIGDQSGLDSVDKRDTNINLKNLEAGDEAKEDTAAKNEDVLELPTSKQAPLATDDAKVASKTKTNTKTPSREDILDDEKIWEKISAMRKIVGYNAPSQPTSIGELKALYVFTGVEPPGSFKGDSDLDEVKAKLKFLMAIVGVK